MSRLIRSSAILAFARFTNYALLFFSPIFLVRILNPYDFGQYREFMAYGTLAASLATFSIPANLLYFIPNDPRAAQRYVSHTNLLVAVGSLAACLVLWLFREPLLAHASYDFLTPLALYVLLFINLDFLESYWIAIQQPRYVFYYSTLRTALRLVAVLGAAFFLRSVQAILAAIILVEAIRILAVLVVARRLNLLSAAVDPPVLRQQLAFIVPIGVAGSLHYVNQSMGQIAVSTQLGVVALAIYTIGSYEVPILAIVRGAVGDAIFPDMVRQASGEGGDRLLLWKRGNVAFSFVILPVFVVLLWYADVLIPLVFTNQYVESVPLFRVFLLVMLLQCFEFSSPLRAVNRTKPLLLGNVLMVLVNLACILATFRFFAEHAIFGPAVGLVAGYVVQLSFFGWSISQAYGVHLKEILKWRSLAKLAISAATAGLVLLTGEYVVMPDIMRVLVFSGFFAAGYFALVRWARLEEVETLTKAVFRELRRA